MLEKIFGRRPVLEALKSNDQKVQRIFISIGTKGASLQEIARIAKFKNIPVEFVNKNLLNKQSRVNVHQGVAADILAVKKYFEISDILTKTRGNKEMPFFVILDEIQDPHNLGAILRTACAAGVHAVIIHKFHAAEITDAVIKTSAGASFHIPVCKVTNIAQTIDILKKDGVSIIGTDSLAETEYTKANYNQPVAVVFGAEGSGMRRLTREKCDQLVFVPMKGKVSSLNVSVASGIVIFEVIRQRSKDNAECRVRSAE